MQPENYIGKIIYENRMKLNLTQDEYGKVYSISGPAVFKFEKGYVQPSLNLWLRMARDAEVTERRAVLLWLKGKLPQNLRGYVELQGAAAESISTYARRSKKLGADYSKPADRDALRKSTAADTDLPQGLRDFLADDEMWALYKPTGAEVAKLRDAFGPLGRGSKASYREALRLLREFEGE